MDARAADTRNGIRKDAPTVVIRHPNDLHGHWHPELPNKRTAPELTPFFTMTTPPTTNSSSHLLSSFDLRGLALRNRVVMAPLTRVRAGRERLPNSLMLEYFTHSKSPNQ